MWERTRGFSAPFPLAMFVVLYAYSGAIADDAAWRVTKSSGGVWVTTSDVQPASLTSDGILKPGDNIRTGRNGRALLVRGDETILISPNSVIGIPAVTNQSRSTTIFQRAGSVLISVEKGPSKHIEVKTAYVMPTRGQVEDQLFQSQIAALARRYLRDLKRDANIQVRDDSKPDALIR